MRPDLYATRRASIGVRRPRHWGLHALMLLTAAVVSTPGHSAEPPSNPGGYDCSFEPATQIAAGTTPYSVAVGDLNGDGVVDIAVANQGSNDVSILLATGAGTFAAASQVAVGSAPQSLVIDDVNGDGKLDLVVANSGDSTLTVRLGTGNGTFGSASTLPVGSAPWALAAADLNKDGKRDLVVANHDGGPHSVSVLLRTGASAFATAVAYALEGNPSDVAIADFNADGKPDLAVTNENRGTVSILFGNGAGGFGAATPIAVGGQLPRSVVSGDFNKDGKPDLAVLNFDSETVSILLGSGGGAFKKAVNYPSSPFATPPPAAPPTELVLVDLDADDRLDLVVANDSWWPRFLSVLRGLDGGTFAAPTAVTIEGYPAHGVAAGDFNADGFPDLVSANRETNDVSILLGDCAAILNITPNAHVDRTSSYELRKSDLWVRYLDFIEGASHPGPFWPFSDATVHTDLNRDGRTDLVRAGISWTPPKILPSTPVQIFMQTAGGSFVNQTPAVLTNDQPGMLWPRKALNGDYNGDGWPDVLVLGHGEDWEPWPGEFNQLFLSNGDGTLRYSPALEEWVGFHHGGASADIDGNGTLDVLTHSGGCCGASRVPSTYFLINDGHGNFTRNTNRLPNELQEHGIWTIELIDVDGDGFIDVLCSRPEHIEGVPTENATIYWGSSSGLYRATNKTVFPTPAVFGVMLDFAAEDIDGDGDRDVIIIRHRPDATGRYFQILRQVAPRQFVDESASRISMDTSLGSFGWVRVQDINGDGSLDIFIDDKYYASSAEYAWTNNGQGVFAPYFGAVNPQMKPPPEQFQINEGLNDAWKNPATPGQGFFVNVFPDIGQVFLAWFTYDTERPAGSATANIGEPGHRWLTAFGPYADNQAVLDIEITQGGVFNAANPAPAQHLDGTVILDFSDCNSGTVTYNIPSIGRQGLIPIQRISSDNTPACEALAGVPSAGSTTAVKTASKVASRAGNNTAATGSLINRGLNDAWKNPATPGQGFFINVFPNLGKMFLAWFTYDTTRPPGSVHANLADPGHRWLTAFGDYTGNHAVLDIEVTQGGIFNAASPAPTQHEGGTVTVDMTDCVNGTVTYDIDSANLHGEIPIQRIALDNVPLCQSLAGQGQQAR